MTVRPQPYPLLARLRYSYFTDGDALPTKENAWWEPRRDGGKLLGAVRDAMNDPRQPHRLSIRLRLGPDFVPLEMTAALLRPDGEGEAVYRFEPDRVTAEGDWNGTAFTETTLLPTGYTVAPHVFAADGLHFRHAFAASDARSFQSYALDPRRETDPFRGNVVLWTAQLMEQTMMEIEDASFSCLRFQAAYDNAEGQPAEFWITEEFYPLRMASERRDGASFHIVCDRFEHPVERSVRAGE